MELFGQHAPGEQQDGYLPGAWDEVRAAYMDGAISEEAYDVLQQTVAKLRGGEGAGAARFRVTIRGEGTEIRGYATPEALAALADDSTDPFIVVASPAEKDYDPFHVEPETGLEEYHAGAIYGIRHPGPRANCPYCQDTIAQKERFGV